MSEIFSEIYGLHYKAMRAILERSWDEEINKKVLRQTVSEILLDPDMIQEFMDRLPEFRLIDTNEKGIYYTMIEDMIDMPLTLLEKRWMKTMLLDPRIALFDISADGLEGIEPLYNPSNIIVMEKYSDGDDYYDEKYIEHFRTILNAIKNEKSLRITFITRGNKEISTNCIPRELEYSARDDRFRLIASKFDSDSDSIIPVDTFIINLSSIKSCDLGQSIPPAKRGGYSREMRTLVLEITDERNARWRASAHFSQFMNRIENLGGDKYRITLDYPAEDEAEIAIRALSFGPYTFTTSFLE